MCDELFKKIKNFFLPCIGFSMAAGFFSAIIITIFKLCADAVINLSTTIYSSVRSAPIWLPVLIIGTAVVGLLASYFYSLSHSCRGGGIPSSVAAIRGIINFRWWSCILILPISALLSFFCGFPLGTEGPCVQLGTAIGDGVIERFAPKKHKGWRRYIMTGGASAGFSIATSAPVTATIFAMEELHNHFSPLLMMVASISVITAQVTVHILATLGIGTIGMFHMPHIDSLDAKFLFAPLLVGIVCGISSMFFTNLYQHINNKVQLIIKKIPVKILFPILFACVSVVGFFIFDTLGSGHSLTEKLFSTQMVWYFILLLFLIRAIIMIVSNTAGVTGGIFLPTLSFGALAGALCGELMILLGWIDAEHYVLMVILGIAAFLGATSHIPVTACVFAIEALGGFNNVLPIIIAVTVSYLVIEMSGCDDFTDTVINSKMHSIRDGKTPSIIDVALTVNKNAFITGKELRNILWPDSCYVVSIERAPEHRGKHEILEGDVITVHYKTYNPPATAEELRILMGEQSEEIEKIMNPV